MDHPVSTPAGSAFQPGRATALIAISVAAALVALLVGGATILARSFHHGGAAKPAHHAARHQAAPRPAPAPRRAPAARPTLSRSHTSVLVLNGNGVSGAAGSASAHVRALGYKLGGVGNANERIVGGSLVMYRPGYRGEAVRLSRDLGVAHVNGLDGLRASDLHGAHLVYILGSS